MINETLRKNINVDKLNSIPLFNLKEGDNAILKLALFKNSVEFDITGQTVRLGAKTKNNLIEQIDGFTISKNNLDIKLKNSILVPGKIEIDLEIKDSNGAMTTASFFITVNQKVLNDEAVEATNEFDTFTKTVEKIEEDYNSLKGGLLAEDKVVYFQNEINKTNSQLDNISSENSITKSEVNQLKEIANTWETFKNNGGEVGGCLSFKKKVRQIQQELDMRDRTYLQRQSLSNYNGYPTWATVIEDPNDDTNTNGMMFMLGTGVEGDSYRDNYFSPLKMGYTQRNYIGSQHVPWDDIYLRGNSKNTNGYTKLPNGLIMQWGETGGWSLAGGGSNNYHQVTLPISYPTKHLCAFASVDWNTSSNSSSYIEYIKINARTNSLNNLVLNAINIQSMYSGTKNFNIKWLSVGY